MNILVIGSGGREHAIIKKLKQSPRVTKLFAAPGNGGIASDAVCVPVPVLDIPGMTELCKRESIDYCVVASDDPLVLGMVDALTKAGVRCFGPNKAAAELEGSKVFSKGLMKKYGIPTAAYETFDNAKEAIEYVKAQNSYPTVIKADGLALGKGVIIAETEKEAIDGICSIMEDKAFGESGSRIVIEEFMTGPEVSVLSFCDSHTIIPMVSAMDHKRALDGDKGLNTGGMGTIAPVPFYTADMADICMEKIYKPTMEAMNKEGRPFKGCIFFGLMITPNGPRVIEFNCRFGDPEAQVVLALLKSDLLTVMEACTDEKLSSVEVEFADKSAACVIMASGGYPQKYETGKEISGLDATKATVYHAGTKLQEGKLLSSGGRVLGVTMTGDTLEEAIKNAYTEVAKIGFEKAFFRKDIGSAALKLM